MEEKLREKKRKFQSLEYKSSFYCPLCGDDVHYFVAYPHLKECIRAYELIYIQNSDFAQDLNQSIPSSISPQPISVGNSITHHSTPVSDPTPSSVSSTIPKERIIREPKCSIPNCTLKKNRFLSI